MPHGISPSQNLWDTPPKIFNALSDVLGNTKWRELAAAVDTEPYCLKNFEIEKIARVLYSGRNPAYELLFCYGKRGMTVEMLACYLDQLQLERALCLIKDPEPLILIQEPEGYIQLTGGDTLKLICLAKGFPYPRYVWFKEQEELHGFRENTLVKQDVSTSDSGVYICRVHNRLKKQKPLFTRRCIVDVKSKDRTPGEHSEQLEGPPPAEDVRVAVGCPVIRTHPNCQRVEHSEPLELVCEAEGATPITYQWMRNGIKLDITGPVLIIDYAQHSNAGEYRCAVKNAYGEVLSTRAIVEVLLPQSGHQDFPAIIRSPFFCGAEEGTRVSFSVEATGRKPLRYKWFHNNQELLGCCSSELSFQASSRSAGFYTCQVYNDCGSALSKEGELKIRDSEVLFARDKVALLIGNSRYRGAAQLPAVVNDIKETTKKLEDLGFKVLSFIDLNLDEMHFVVNFFCSLLSDGVYGLFYFAGHGFVRLHQHYMLPWDPREGDRSPQNCLCAEEVENLIQQRNPALCVMFLEHCRIEEPIPMQERLREMEPVTPKVKGNLYIFYASSYGEQAFENEDDVPRGIFSKFLLNVIDQKKSPPLVFMDYLEEYKNKYTCANCNQPNCKCEDKFPQHPEMVSKAMDTKRTLADPIYYTGNTKEMDKRSRDYKIISSPPENFPRLAVRFKKVLTNVLEMQVNDPEFMIAEDLIPAAIRPVSFRRSATGTVVSFENLQRLQTDLRVTCHFKNPYKLTEEISLGLPLMAKMSRAIWASSRDRNCRQRSPSGPREPREQEEEKSFDLSVDVKYDTGSYC